MHVCLATDSAKLPSLKTYDMDTVLLNKVEQSIPFLWSNVTPIYIISHYQANTHQNRETQMNSISLLNFYLDRMVTYVLWHSLKTVQTT